MWLLTVLRRLVGVRGARLVRTGVGVAGAGVGGPLLLDTSVVGHRIRAGGVGTVTVQRLCHARASTRQIAGHVLPALPYSLVAQVVQAVVVDAEVVGDLVDDGDVHLVDDPVLGLAHP